MFWEIELTLRDTRDVLGTKIYLNGTLKLLKKEAKFCVLQGKWIAVELYNFIENYLK